jgi:hypothetical protein
VPLVRARPAASPPRPPARPSHSARADAPPPRPAPADASAAADGDNADDYDYDAVVAGGAKGAKGAAPRPPQPAAPAPPPATRLEALRACSFEDLECVRAAHALPAGGAKFNFPHFMIIGFQKAATTSLNAYLDKHPQVERSWPKEPEFLSKDCNWRLEACPPRATRKYFRATLDVDAYLAKGGSVAHSEASTHYVRNGDRLAVQMRHFMPWLRLVFSLRDPISRAASMLIHKKDKHGDGCLATRPLPECLLEDSQISGNGAGASSTNYSYPVSVWAREWPREQLHVIQVRGGFGCRWACAAAARPRAHRQTAPLRPRARARFAASPPAPADPVPTPPAACT